MKKTLTRSDLADFLYEDLGYSHNVSLAFVDSVFNIMTSTLAAGEELKLSGFASFIPHQKRSRVGRNPRTGKEYTISPRTVISFRASHLLKKAIAGKR